MDLEKIISIAHELSVEELYKLAEFCKDFANAIEERGEEQDANFHK